MTAPGEPLPATYGEHLMSVDNQRRIVLINLAKGVIGSEAARLLGSLCLMSVWQAALLSLQPSAIR